MIHPDLATMLAVVTTDYPLEPGEAIEFLRPAVESSFNAISVDGEPLHERRLILLANGASGRADAATDAAFARGAERGVRRPRAQIVADGEGITVLAEITVTGAASDAAGEARSPSRIATSPLVKTALFGHDANWGRVLMAAGSAPFNGGYATSTRRASRSRTTARPFSTHGAPHDAEPDVAGAELHDRARPRPRRRQRAAT